MPRGIYIRTEEHKKSLRLSHKGMLGKNHSILAKKRISKSNKEAFKDPKLIEDIRKRFTTHGMYGAPEYNSYRMMLNRCKAKTGIWHIRYSKRGISVCDRWLNSFENFYIDMGPKPVGYTLERIDNNESYSPINCKWASRKEQANNRSYNHG